MIVASMPMTDQPSRREKMAKVINCECGEVVRADTDDELVEKVERHVGEAHPELVGKMSREDVLAMAEEA
jgi:predicted small metal-binding protein